MPCGIGDRRFASRRNSRTRRLNSIVPRKSQGRCQAVYYYGLSLTDLGQYQDAIVQFDKASALDKDDPLPRHWKADLLFRLGRYEEGWKGWWAAGNAMSACWTESCAAERLEKALYFAGVLGEIFESYEESDKLYKRVLERQNGNADAWAGTRHSQPAMGQFGCRETS